MQPVGVGDTGHFVPADLRGTGYGFFTAAYGLAWLVGSTVIGALYSHSVTTVAVFVIATQVIALVLFVPLAARSPGGPGG